MFTRCELKETLKDGVATVTFKKVNGDVREMRCTLNEKLLPPRDEKAKVKKDNPSILAAYDLDKKAWRSFKVDQVILVTSEVKSDIAQSQPAA